MCACSTNFYHLLVSLELLSMHAHVQILRNLSGVCGVQFLFVLEPHLLSCEYVF